jgi:glycosyltransferase involved in cell wall biosynthesis
MKKILYIAPVKDFSGYATASRGYVRALHKAGADIAVRSVSYDKADSNKGYQPTELELGLLKKPIYDADIIIQHITPNEMRLPRTLVNKVNIAISAWETNRIPDYWVKKLNQFDGVITFCDTSVKAFCDSGVTVPVYKVPHCFDIASYSNIEDIKPLELQGGGNEFLDNRFIFYNISQFGQKKGLDVLLQAYFYAFYENPQDVLLILKTYVQMYGRQDEDQKISQWIAQIKASMRLPQYPPVALITATMTEEQVRRLHALGDCYANSARAEGWSIPAFEALACGKKLVTTNWGGMQEYVNCGNNVYLVDYSLQPLVGQQHADPDLYTAKDLVAEPSILGMAGAMQRAKESVVEQAPDLSKFDYNIVGPQMLQVIETIVASKTQEVANV